jgi:hypothetical protein
MGGGRYDAIFRVQRGVKKIKFKRGANKKNQNSDVKVS